MKYVIALFLLITTVSVHAENAQAIADKIAADAQSRADAGKFSGVVLVAKDGKILLHRAWGNATETSKNTLDTTFNIGSINKAFTRRAIEQLAAQGKLSLDDTIRKHLPDYPLDYADRVTIRQLLEHRGGLGTLFGPAYETAPPSKLRELSDFLEVIKTEPLRFEPGTSQKYSNSGYVVLGLIIERITGQKYRDYVQKTIFDPAGMKNAGFWAKDEKVANRATGFTNGKSNYDTLPGRPSSAGGAYMTAIDLFRFLQWMKVDGIGVAGGAPGVNAMADVDNGWTVIVMSNLDPPSAESLAETAMGFTGRPQGMKRRAPSAPQNTEMSGPVAVPLGQLNHLATVEVRVNGKGPFKFVLDSGAGGMLRVSKDLADSLGLEQIGEALAGDPSEKNMERRPIVRVNTIEIGGAKFSGVDATIQNRGAGGDGVIGLALFGGLTARIDYPNKELRLTREPLPATGEHVRQFTLAHGIPQISINLGGKELLVDVDSGSPALVTITGNEGLAYKDEPRVVGHARTSSNEFDIKGAELRGDLQVLGWKVTAPRVDIVDIFPHGHVGSRFLREYAVVFDLENSRLALLK